MTPQIDRIAQALLSVSPFATGDSRSGVSVPGRERGPRGAHPRPPDRSRGAARARARAAGLAHDRPLYERAAKGETVRWGRGGGAPQPRYPDQRREVHLRPIHDENGEIWGLALAVSDAPMRRRAEGRVAESDGPSMPLLSRAGRAASLARSREKLLRDVCEIAAESGQFVFAWVASRAAIGWCRWPKPATIWGTSTRSRSRSNPKRRPFAGPRCQAASRVSPRCGPTCCAARGSRPGVMRRAPSSAVLRVVSVSGAWSRGGRALGLCPRPALLLRRSS